MASGQREGRRILLAHAAFLHGDATVLGVALTVVLVAATVLLDGRARRRDRSPTSR